MRLKPFTFIKSAMDDHVFGAPFIRRPEKHRDFRSPKRSIYFGLTVRALVWRDGQF
jgi:hypothetical protein